MNVLAFPISAIEKGRYVCGRGERISFQKRAHLSWPPPAIELLKRQGFSGREREEKKYMRKGIPERVQQRERIRSRKNNKEKEEEKKDFFLSPISWRHSSLIPFFHFDRNLQGLFLSLVSSKKERPLSPFEGSLALDWTSRNWHWIEGKERRKVLMHLCKRKLCCCNRWRIFFSQSMTAMGSH